MNKKQKEVELAKLAEEKNVLDALKKQYMQAADDVAKKISFHTGKIDALLSDWDNLDEVEKSILQSQIYQRKYQQSLQKQIGEIIDNMNEKQYQTVEAYLKGCYETGFIGSLYDIHGQGIPIIIPINQKAMVKAVTLDSKVSKKLYGSYVDELKKRIQAEVSRGVATNTQYSVIARNLNMQAGIGFNKAMRITRTEGHGVQVQAAVDVQHKAKEAGADIVKQWDSTLDGRTRESHRRVDGEIRELDEKFSNGMMFPSDSAGGAAEVVNCRCALLQRAKWALDEDELQTLKDRAEFFKLDKTENFEDFKQKYLNINQKFDEIPKNSFIVDIDKLPPVDYEYNDYEEYRKATNEWRSKHNESPYDYFVQNSIWSTSGESAKVIERIKRFDTTIAKLEKEYPLYRETANNLYIGTYKDMGSYLTSIQRSRMDESLAQAQFWFNPENNSAVIGFNPYGVIGTLEDDLLIRSTKIKNGEYLLSVLDNSPEGYAIHEWGHGMSEYITESYSNGDKAAEEYWEWYKSLSKEDIINGVSSYAATNRGEFEAECFAEILTGNPRPIAKKYGEYLRKCVKSADEFIGNSEKSDIINNNLNNLLAIKRDTSSIKTIILPKKEYAHVMSEIASNITEEQQKQKVLTKPIGDYFYTFENNGFGEYRIIGKKPIDEEALEWWDE